MCSSVQRWRPLDVMVVFSAMNRCNMELFLKMGTLLPELAVHEKAMDYFIDALRKDQVITQTLTETR